MHRDHKTISSRTKGIGLLELVIYIGMLSMFIVVIIATLIQIVGAYNQVRAQREVVSNGRLVVEAITQTIASGQALYAPTSTLGNTTGQLSIVTTLGAQPEETVNHVDFWLDNGRVWMHKEGSATTSITSPSVRVNQLRFDQMSQGFGREAVQITLQITDFVSAKFTASSTLHTTVALRGTY